MNENRTTTQRCVKALGRTNLVCSRLGRRLMCPEKVRRGTVVIRAWVVEGLVTIRGSLLHTIGKLRRILIRKTQ